tara:strand:- start:2421 stop:2726 length:306 start_codon:yes stop_codon:yes gene_type:complete
VKLKKQLLENNICVLYIMSEYVSDKPMEGGENFEGSLLPGMMGGEENFEEHAKPADAVMGGKRRRRRSAKRRKTSRKTYKKKGKKMMKKGRKSRKMRRRRR